MTWFKKKKNKFPHPIINRDELFLWEENDYLYITGYNDQFVDNGFLVCVISEDEIILSDYNLYSSGKQYYLDKCYLETSRKMRFDEFRNYQGDYCRITNVSLNKRKHITTLKNAIDASNYQKILDDARKYIKNMQELDLLEFDKNLKKEIIK